MKYLLNRLSIFVAFFFIITTNVISQDKMPQILEHYKADKGSLERFYVIDASPERRARMLAFNNSYLTQIKSLPFSKLSQSDKVDYLLFKNQLEGNVEELNEEAASYALSQKWVDFGLILYDQEKARRRGSKLDGQKTAMTWNTLSKDILINLSTLASVTPLAKTEVNYITKAIRGYRKSLKSIHDFYDSYDPSYSWWTKNAYQKLDSLLNVYNNAVLAKLAPNAKPPSDKSGIVGNPIGSDAIGKLLEKAFIPYTAAELIKVAEKEFAWCDVEIRKAARELGYGDNWKAAQEMVKNTYVPVGEQPSMIMGLYNQSIDFIKKKDMITIPPLAEETWRMTMMTPKQQLVSPFFLGGETLMISYPTDAMEEDAKLMSMRGNNPHFSRATVHHELIAGHHLQGFMNNRYKSYRNFNTPFWTEGWALYWEFLLWDKGFPRNAEDKIGMLFWRMHRCARIIFSLNYHLEKWTPQECIDFLVDRVGHETANAEGEVRRSFTGGYGPLYQLAYMMGALQIRSLKEELVDTGKMSLKQFNDAVMRENNMPIEMLRALLINAPLKEDYTTQWKFYKF